MMRVIRLERLGMSISFEYQLGTSLEVLGTESQSNKKVTDLHIPGPHTVAASWNLHGDLKEELLNAKGGLT